MENEEIIEAFRKEWRCHHSNCGTSGICQRDRITEFLDKSLTSQQTQLRELVEKKKQDLLDIPLWNEFTKGEASAFDEILQTLNLQNK